MNRSRREQIDPITLMDVMEQARAPGALAARMQRRSLGCTVSSGLPGLRAGIAAFYQRWHGIDVNPDRVIVTSGSSGASLPAFSALFEAVRAGIRTVMKARSGMRAYLWAAVVVIASAFSVSAFSASAQELSALARLIPDQSSIRDTDAGAEVVLALSQPVPWRVRLMDNPPRLVLDFREVDWAGLSDVTVVANSVQELRAGVFRPGWSRLVLALSGPMIVGQAEMSTMPGTVLRLRLDAASAGEFAAKAAAPEPPEWATPKPADLPARKVNPADPLVIVLDPGHGGIDPGAERDGFTEADLVLTFARELKELIVRDGRFAVVMTRDDDTFVPLEARISIARAAGAFVLMSLHADTLAEGEAVGATIYTLSDQASDEASSALAERHDRDDLLAGVDLTEQDDLVAEVLMDMARTRTTPRTERLAMALEASILAAELKMHRNPRQQAGFSVLKSPDIPSLLMELGFLSSARDLARLRDPEWRSRMTAALRDGLNAWVEQDLLLSGLRAP